MACSLSLYITGLYVLMLAPVFIEIFSGSASFPPNHSASEYNMVCHLQFLTK